MNVSRIWDKDYREYLKNLVIFPFLIAVAGIFIFSVYPDSTVHSFFVQIFSDSVGYILSLVSSEESGLYYDAGLKQFFYAERWQEIIVPESAFLPLILIFTTLVVYNTKKPIEVSVFTVAVLMLLILRSLTITATKVYLHDSPLYILLLLYDTIIYLPVLGAVLFMIRYNPFFSKLYQRFLNHYREQFSGNPFLLVLAVLFIPALPRVLPAVFSSDIITTLIHATIKHTALLIQSFTAYEPVAQLKYLFIGKNWISLEPPCLGTGVVSIVLIFVFFTKSPLLHKLSYSVLFILLFHFVNTLRLAWLLVYIVGNPSSLTAQRVELHDYITYFMYGFALLGIFAYQRWYSALRFAARV